MMPIYEYGCAQCKHVFDVLQKIDEPPPPECPQCGAKTLRKLVSAPSFRLKGTGWYETDFKQDKRRQLADGDSKAPAAPANGEAKAGHTLDGTGEKKEKKSGHDHGHGHSHDHGHSHSHGHKHEH